jgi:hypothetical protein
MKRASVIKYSIAASAFACTVLLSLGWSEQRGVSLSVENAEARIGRPLTPVSVAGVARRQSRRAVYGAGIAGAAAVGTAGAIAAAPYYRGMAYYGGAPYGAGTAPYAYGNRTGVWGQDYARLNNFSCQPGTMVKLDDGLMHLCQ